MAGQPDINAVIRSQQFYRLKQVVESPGSIYEIDESTLAIYIGPDSDIGEINVQYFNPDVPLGIETATVAVNGPFVGRLDALLKTRIPSSGQPARLLVSPVDIVDNAYAPPDSLAVRRFNIPAVIDVIFGLKPQPEIPAVRTDRTLRFPRVPFYGAPIVGPTNDGSTDLIVPIYGRRMVTVTAISEFGVDVSMSLVTLQPGVPTIPRPLGSYSILFTLPPRPFSRAAVIRASDAGRIGRVFDLTTGPPPVSNTAYVESDQPPGDTGTDAFGEPQVRGLADLLVINLLQNINPAAPPEANPATQFADVFVKIADRET